MLHIHFISIFPDLIRSALSYSIPYRAEQSGLVQYDMIDPRTFTEDKHQKVDDSPFGGGPGMLIKAEPIAKSIESLSLPEGSEIIFTDPTGERFNQNVAWKLSSSSHLVFVCGRYEGIDERVQEQFATRIYSIGDYILSGGEFAALVMADAVVRLIPGALGKAGSLHQDSFVEGLLSFPQYTRPKSWRGYDVPEVLISGNHQEVANWRKQQALLRTKMRRPDLFSQLELTKDDIKLLK